MRNFVLIPLLIVFFSCSKEPQTDSEPIIIDPVETSEIYFPDILSNTWDTKSISDLGWKENELTPLISFLDENNTKSFIILHNGKIVVEEYLNGHSNTNTWYWASAGKTLTTAMSGIAQEQGFININTKISDYLGTGWTSATLEKESLITCKNLLSMNSGLDDSLGDSVTPNDLTYVSDAGTRWAYHNVYVKMQTIIATASNNNWNTYFNTELRDKIGMSGNWVDLNDLSVYWSNTRSMARFGLLMFANGKWADTQIVPTSFLQEATTTSQNINLAYGYLWWLNGKASFHLPTSQLEFDGHLIPNAPADLYAALGKNDQKIYVVQSKKLVIIRMGQAADEENFALSSFDNMLWEKINALIN